MKTIRVKSEARQWAEAVIAMLSILGTMYVMHWAAYIFAPESWIK